ncbi:MAG TPA: hypothetical protein VFA18_12470, partial [Gemmataceae bacterium]|nr:hypothetical protein [Gemmataceae bacterium]
MSKLPLIRRHGPSAKKPRARSKAQHNLQLQELEARLLMSSNVPAQGTFTAVLGNALSARVLIQTPSSLQQHTTLLTTAQSPTGHTPQLLWSGQQQGVWKAMV